MEKDDILTCKCDFDNVFHVGNKYMIMQIEFSSFYNDHRVYISSSPINDSTDRGHGIYWFFLNKPSEYNLYKYFSDIKAIRKEKLKKLDLIC